jgi:hypothetical protein
MLQSFAMRKPEYTQLQVLFTRDHISRKACGPTPMLWRTLVQPKGVLTTVSRVKEPVIILVLLVYRGHQSSCKTGRGRVRVKETLVSPHEIHIVLIHAIYHVNSILTLVTVHQGSHRKQGSK